MIFVTIPLISITNSLILIYPLIMGIINIKEVRKSPLKVIFNYCILLTFIEILAWIFVLNGWQNHFINNSINYIDVCFFGYYYTLVIKSKGLNNLIKGLIVVSIILIGGSHIGREFNRIDPFSHSVVNITMICMALIFFYQLLNNLEIKNLLTYSHFWIGVSILLYFSGVFFMHIFSEYIAFNTNEAITDYWYIREYLSFAQRIFLGIGFGLISKRYQ